MTGFIRPLQIGPYQLPHNLLLAPMAGITDAPFRTLCSELGAAYTVSEMISSQRACHDTTKTATRLQRAEADALHVVQLVGAEPDVLAAAARHNVALGAQIIDINMGCPAKKVCRKLAGSALLADERLVRRILAAVVAAVDVPVTLKIRTGADRTHRNGATIARIAEQEGIACLAVHGRTRADRFKGDAEYETIARIKQVVDIPVIANGDIDSPEKALQVFACTGADGVMIGRAAQGNPFLFRQTLQYAAHGHYAGVSRREVQTVLLRHLHGLYDLYGEYRAVRIARKHIGWYCAGQASRAPAFALFREQVNRVESAAEQLALVDSFFSTVAVPGRLHLRTEHAHGLCRPQKTTYSANNSHRTGNTDYYLQ